MFNRLKEQIEKNYDAINQLMYVLSLLQLDSTKLFELYSDYLKLLHQMKMILDNEEITKQDWKLANELDGKSAILSKQINEETKKFFELEEVRNVIIPIITLFGQSQQNNNDNKK